MALARARRPAWGAGGTDRAARTAENQIPVAIGAFPSLRRLRLQPAIRAHPDRAQVLSRGRR